MAARFGQKLKLIYIIDILKKYTDDEHPMNATELCEFLAEKGVSAERKAVYNDIEMLIYYGWDIIKTRVPKAGYFLASREFELPEIYLLADAVRSADFITPKKTRELLNKIDSFLSIHQSSKREKITYISSRYKCKNEAIYYNIDKINAAVEKGVKVKVTYLKRYLTDDKKINTDEKVMCISPYATLWESDRYYLVGNNEKYDNLIHLRLDRIKKVELTEEKARHFSDVSDYQDTFDVSDYAAKTFNMYGGEDAEIELKCKKERLEQIIDRFSDEISVYKLTDDTFSFTTGVIISDGLISWLLQFGSDIEVVKPESLRRRISSKIKELNKIY